MRRQEILILSQNVLEALALKGIIGRTAIVATNINCALSIEKAVASLNIIKPNIIILDIMFDDGKFIDFFKSLKFTGIKIILISPKRGEYLDGIDRSCANYIFKPFNENNIGEIINKVIGVTLHTENPENFQMVTISSSSKKEFININDIVFCEASGNYTIFYLTDGQEIISSKNLGLYEKILNNSFFYRVHHAYIINIKFLTSVIKDDGVFCKLVNDINVPISKRKHSEFKKFLRLN